MSQRNRWEFRKPREKRRERPREDRDPGPKFVTGLMPAKPVFVVWEPEDEMEDVNELALATPGNQRSAV